MHSSSHSLLEDVLHESSPSPRVRAAARVVMEGFGDAYERRAKPLDLLAVEAFQEVAEIKQHDATAASSPPRSLSPSRSEPRQRSSLSALKPSSLRVDKVIKSLRSLFPSRVDLSDDEGLGDAGIERLCSSLMAHKALTELRLPNCGCGFTGANRVAELIAVHVHLRVVELSRNATIGDAGASALGRALRSSCKLEVLELRSCGIGDEGAIAIASALIARRGYAPLAHLVLSFNKDIGEAGVDALRKAAEQWSCGRLTRIDLSGASASAATLSACQHALTPEGRQAPDGAALWAQGLHSAFTMRFADPAVRTKDGDAASSLSIQPPRSANSVEAASPYPAKTSATTFDGIESAETPTRAISVPKLTEEEYFALTDPYDAAMVRAMTAHGVQEEEARAVAAKAAESARAAATEAIRAETAAAEKASEKAAENANAVHDADEEQRLEEQVAGGESHAIEALEPSRTITQEEASEAAFAVRAAATRAVERAEAIRSEAERLANERGQLDALQPSAVGGHGKALGQREQQEAAEAAEAMKAAAAQAAMTVQAVAKTLEAAEVAVQMGEEPGESKDDAKRGAGRMPSSSSPPPSPPPEAEIVSVLDPATVAGEDAESELGPMRAPLRPVPLTGNREMAEDLEREPCPTCNRTFAPSVLARHASICAKRAAKLGALN